MCTLHQKKKLRWLQYLIIILFFNIQLFIRQIFTLFQQVLIDYVKGMESLSKVYGQLCGVSVR